MTDLRRGLALLLAAGVVLLGVLGGLVTAAAAAGPSATAAGPVFAAAAGPVSAAPVAGTLAAAAVPLSPLVPSPTPTAPADPGSSPAGPEGPSGPAGGGGGADVKIKLGDLTEKPSTPVVVLLGLTLLTLVPAILLTTTSFTKILVVLGLTRNALGLQQIPPNQVLAGLALFLSLFIMSPVLSEMNDEGLQPYLDGTKTQSQAWEDGIDPLREFMLDQTGDEELGLLTEVADRPMPQNRDDVELTTLVPAFVLSELKQAFIIGFVIFIPFLVIDIVVSAALMSLGMMMMPPVMVSLPFKLLLFVLVDGWGLVVRALVSSYGGG